MAETRPLLFTVAGDATISPDSTQAWRIRAIGTDKTAEITPKISGNDVGPIRQEVASLHQNATNPLGPLELGDWYYYVPPEDNLELDGASGDDVVLIGERIDGVPAGQKFVSSADETRWNEQGKKHYTYVQGTVDLTSDIDDGQEDTVFTLTPATDERYQFTGVQYVSRTAGSWSEGEGLVNVFWDLDGQRIPSQFNDDSSFGIDYVWMDRDQDHANETTPFVYNRYLPDKLQDSNLSVSEVGGGHNAFAGVRDFVVTGDMTYQVKVRNVSGGTLTEGSTTTWEYIALVRFEEAL
jgi:hypothetical protein